MTKEIPHVVARACGCPRDVAHDLVVYCAFCGWAVEPCPGADLDTVIGAHDPAHADSIHTRTSHAGH